MNFVRERDYPTAHKTTIRLKRYNQFRWKKSQSV